MRVLNCLFLGLMGAVTSSLGQLAESATATKPLGVGASLPAVSLQTSAGAEFALAHQTAGKPVVLLFYRGGWCPYCTKHLAEIQTIEKQLLALGYQILAISPDPAPKAAATREKTGVNYTVLSDPEMKAAAAFGLAFALDQETVTKYKGYKIELTAKQGDRFWLPVPAAYLVDAKGKIVYAHTDPDYRKRLSSAELLQAARAAVAH